MAAAGFTQLPPRNKVGKERNVSCMLEMMNNLASITVSIVAIVIAIRNNRKSGRIALAARRSKILHLGEVLAETLNKVWGQRGRQLLTHGSEAELMAEWLQLLLDMPRLKRLVPKSEKRIWESQENLLEYLHPMVIDVFGDAEFYFENKRISTSLDAFSDLLDLLADSISTRKSDMGGRCINRNLREITQTINQVLQSWGTTSEMIKREMSLR